MYSNLHEYFNFCSQKIYMQDTVSIGSSVGSLAKVGRLVSSSLRGPVMTYLSTPKTAYDKRLQWLINPYWIPQSTSQAWKGSSIYNQFALRIHVILEELS